MLIVVDVQAKRARDRGQRDNDPSVAEVGRDG